MSSPEEKISDPLVEAVRLLARELQDDRRRITELERKLSAEEEEEGFQ